VKVNSFGKWKTAFQMVAMSTLLVLRQPQADVAKLLASPFSGESLGASLPARTIIERPARSIIEGVLQCAGVLWPLAVP
jgi:phosphatidylglycerophosphate synthase